MTMTRSSNEDTPSAREDDGSTPSRVANPFDTLSILREIDPELTDYYLTCPEATVAQVFPVPRRSEKVIRMSEETWTLFYGALVGLRLPGVTGDHFYSLPRIREAVEAVQNAEDA